VRRVLLTGVTLAMTGGLTALGLLAVAHSPRIALHSSPSRAAGARVRRASASTATDACRGREPSLPFTGIAVNPPIVARAKSFAAATGARPQVVEFYTAFGKPFSRPEADQVASLDAVPLVQLNPRHASLASIAAGKWDPYLRRYAAAVRAFRCPLALSFGHEMNGWWYPWGEPDSSPAEFIAAWRHIHAVFTAAHASNVIWSWDPDHGGSKASRWWPGAAYVDWVGLDGYQRPGQTFASIFGRQLANIRSFTAKPVFLAETAVAPGPQQQAQITGLFAAVRRYRLAGLVWFDLNRKEPWRLEGRPAAIAAFRAGMRSLRH
jgi:mannan endo-1,4-beta-mannosidase